jgi:hypothetical protein
MLTSYQWQKNAAGTQYNFQYVTETATPFPSPPFPQGRGAGFPGGTLAMTVNTTETPAAAVVWAVAHPQPSGSCDGSAGRNCPGYLLAYKLDGATNPGALTLLWPSLPLSTSADFQISPYAIPTAVNGRVYVATYSLSGGASGVEVYGLQ